MMYFSTASTNQNLFYRRIFGTVYGQVFATVLVVLIALVVFAPHHAAAVDLAGIPTDEQCDIAVYDDSNFGNNSGLCPGSSGGGGYKYSPSSGCNPSNGAYNPGYFPWISTNTNSAQDDQENIAYGTTTVPLMYNNLIYVCHPAVSGSPYFPNDGNPYSPFNDGLGSVELPTRSVYYVDSATATSSAGSGGTVSGLAGDTFTINGYPSQPTTRYWFSSSGGLNFSYNSYAPITQTETITIYVTQTPVAFYPNGAVMCVNGAYPAPDPGSPPTYGCNPGAAAPFSMILEVPPQYHLDVATCSELAGWAFDGGDPSASIPVDIYVGGPAGSGAPGKRFIADVSRPDVDAAYGITGNHGFNINIATDPFLSQYISGSSITLYLYAISVSGGPNVAFSNDPVVINTGSCDSHPPNITATADCKAEDIFGTASDADDPGGTLTVSWNASNGASGQLTTTGNYTISTASFDQLNGYWVSISVGDIARNGSPGDLGSASPNPNPVTYGPCLTAACGGASIPPTIITNPAGTPFPVTVSISLIPTGASATNPYPASSGQESSAPGGPYTDGTLSDSFTGPGGTYTGFNPPSSNYYSPAPNGATNLTNSIATPGMDGTYTLLWTFTDPEAPSPYNDINCSETSIPVSNAPYYSANGGSVEAGSAFGSSSCEDLNSAGTSNLIGTGMDGIIGYNQNTAPGYIGAGSQLAAEALGQIYGFASEQDSGASPPTGLSLSNTADNIPAAEDYGGGFGYASCPPTIDPTGSTVLTPLGPGNSLSGLNGKYVVTGSITLNASTIGTGDDVQLYVNSGNIYIDGPIEYNTAGWNTPADIPSLTVVTNGGNIYINPSVTQLDGTYIAQPLETISGSQQNYNNTTTTTGIIYDCTNNTASGQFPTGTADCNNTLTVNGAFIANQIKFQRAYGNVNGTTGIAPTPAEQFNYSPEEWLNSANTSPETYDSITALPPVL